MRAKSSAAERKIRTARLAELGFRTYDAYLRSSGWRKRRAAYRKTHEPLCTVCEGTHGLQLHHVTYVRLGRERDADLRWLCDLCHSTLHTMEAVSLDPDALFSAERAKQYAKPDQEPFVPLNQRGARQDRRGRLRLARTWRDDMGLPRRDRPE